MKNVIIFTVLSFLTGCASVFNNAVTSLPSVRDCQSVSYNRVGNQIKISASCSVPLASSPLVDIKP